MISIEAKKQLSEILEKIGDNLDITQKQHDDIVARYEAVGNWLADEESELAPYKPTVLPQGSFLFGTIIKPVAEDDEIDFDLVCRLEGKKESWTQAHLKKVVGDRLKAHGKYEAMLRKEGRRCWTLGYSKETKFHMDVLPAIVSQDYQILLEKAFSADEYKDESALAIRITDNTDEDYKTSSNPDDWPKSNPFGYANWFRQRASLMIRKAKLFNESVIDAPDFEEDKLPLQRAVQILKRHRDIMFNGDEDKPISIIITTLAGLAYGKETDVVDALLNILARMEDHIHDWYDEERETWIKKIANPVNAEENFADKWPDNPQRRKNFYAWLDQARKDFDALPMQRGLYSIQESLEKSLGSGPVFKAFSDYATKTRIARESGNLHSAVKSGTLGSAGAAIKNHNFYGKKEE